MGPTQKENKTKTKESGRGVKRVEKRENFLIFFILFVFLRFTEI